MDATLTDEKSSFVSGYGSRSVVLKEGKNTILIKIKAENESEKTYTINVTRKTNKSSNNYLSEIKLSNGNINFDRDKVDYSISVSYDVDEIDVDVKNTNSLIKTPSLTLLKLNHEIDEIMCEIQCEFIYDQMRMLNQSKVSTLTALSLNKVEEIKEEVEKVKNGNI